AGHRRRRLHRREPGCPLPVPAYSLTMVAQLEMVSPRKVLWHREKVADFLADRPIFPATLELGITTACDRSCPDCPSRLGQPGLYLSMETAERLFALCRGRTFGVIFSGGEPTLHPGFGRLLAKARENDFRDVVVISNGSRLDREEVTGPLLSHATAVRVSLYDWREDAPPGRSPTLERIGRLRAAIEKAGSPLQVGVSLLTQGVSHERIGLAAAAVRAAGAHWLYLHPTCVSTPSGPGQNKGQELLMAALESCSREQAPGFAVHYLKQRFSTAPVAFQGYHAAHFVMVVGADGVNYLSSETKYQPSCRIATEADYEDNDFFSDPVRRARIAAVHADDYPAGGGRNRGVFYSQVLEEARQSGAETGATAVPDFLMPHIL
ncbi:MAG TPA: radical SAM protein, partial [Acidobacteriota bacterium]